MIYRRRLLASALAATALAAAPAAAAGKAWTTRATGDYEGARFEQTTLTPEGRVTLSPAVQALGELPQPFLWCLAVDSKGRVHAGGGNEGQVYRVGEAGIELAFDAPEVEVQAIAFDRRDRLYAASSPEGRVYRVEEGKAGSVFFEPEARYIWALAFDRFGDLLVATGQPGRIYRVDESGKSRILLESRDDHIRTLVPDDEGGFLAGSDGDGVIYRIPRDGEPLVLYDSPSREIAALAVLDGEIYAAGLRPIRQAGGQQGGTPPTGAATRVQVSADGTGEDGEGEEEPQGGRQRARSQPRDRFEGAIYRIDRSGFARQIWSSQESLPLSIAAGPSGRLLVGLNSRGRIASLTPGGDMSEYTAVAGSQVTALRDAGRGGVVAATSNLGAVFAIRADYAREGTLAAEVHDAGFESRWGALAWEAETPGGTEILFQVRTGDTRNPDATWSEWSEPVSESGAAIDRPPARYLQWMATLRSQGEETPVLKSVRVHYLPENMPPFLDKVEVLDPGVSLQPSAPAPSPSPGAEPRPRTGPPPKQTFERGMRSVRWEGGDPNEDPVQATVQFRSEDGGEWKTLRAGLEQSFFAWDSTAMPDGVYRVRVTLSDEAVNAPGRGRTGSRMSAPFDVDNSPPRVSGLEAAVKSRRAVVTARIEDSFSVVEEAAYSVDAAEWVVLLPEDGVADSPAESFRFETGELPPGEHQIVIRARDSAGNTTTDTVSVTVR